MATIRGELWSTPNEPPTVSMSCRRLSIPMHLVDAVGGAITMLTDAANWEQVGDESILDVISEMTEMWVNTREEITCVNAIGTLQPFALDEVPEWLLLCDGSIYSEEDYPELYAVISGSFKLPNSQFKVPDLVDYFIFGGVIQAMADQGGEERVTLSTSEMPTHNHSFSNYTYGIDVEGVGIPDPTGVGLPKLPTESTGNKGNGNSHNNMPPYVTFPIGIVYK